MYPRSLLSPSSRKSGLTSILIVLGHKTVGTYMFLSLDVGQQERAGLHFLFRAREVMRQ
jgi:hypothetical protein